jgi:putative exporter of polyketide antibiotics
MANVSTARKVGIAARVAGQQVKRTRTYGAVLSGARATLAHFAAILRQLWLEVTGFVFLAFAAVGATAMVREYAAYHAGKSPVSKVAVAAAFTLMFGWFGFSSFFRARRRNKPHA